LDVSKNYAIHPNSERKLTDILAHPRWSILPDHNFEKHEIVRSAYEIECWAFGKGTDTILMRIEIACEYRRKENIHMEKTIIQRKHGEKMKVLIICVNYNTYEHAKNYLNSIDEAAVNAGLKVTVIISDNSDLIETIEPVYHNIELHHIITNQNLGYLGAVTYGIRKSGIKVRDFSYSIISNVDVSLPVDFFKILEVKKYSEKVGCIAPSIFSISENKDRNPKLLTRPSKKKLEILRIMYSIPAIFDLYVKFIYKNRKTIKFENETIIFAPHGSFMIFMNSFADFIQSFSYRTFLFCEENFFGENLRNMKLSVIYDPDLKVTDSDHVNTRNIKRGNYYKWNIDAITNLLEDYYSE